MSSNQTQIHVDTSGIKQNPAVAAVQGLAHGQPPTNAQVSHVMEHTQEFLDQKKHDATVTPQAAKVLGDAQELVQATQQMFENKNADEHLQKMAVASAAAAKEGATSAKTQIAAHSDDPAIREKARTAGEHAKQSGTAILNVFKSTIQSGEFRTWLVDFVGLAHDIVLKNAHSHSSTTGATTGTPAIGVATHPAESYDPSETSEDWDSNLNDQAKHQLAERFVTLLRRINASPESKQNIRNLVDSLDELREEALSAGKGLSGGETMSSHTATINAEAKSLISEFHDPQPLLQSVRALAKDIQHDEKMNHWLQEVKSLLKEVLNHPETVDHQDLVKRIERLIDEGRTLAKDVRWRKEYQNVIRETRTMVRSIKNDPDVKNVSQKAAQLAENFTYIDETGQRRFNSDLMSEMRQFIVPMFLKQLENIPVPPIEGSNEDYDFKVSNVTFSGKDLIPDYVEVHIRSDMEVNVKELSAEHASNRALLKVSHIKTHMDNINFWFQRKSFPKIEDSGIANIAVMGEGATVQVLLRVSNGWEQPTFNLVKVDVDIDQVKIDVKDAKHNVLLGLITSLFKGTIKRRVETAIEEKIQSIFHDIETGINELMVKYPPKRLAHMVGEQAKSATSAIGHQTSGVTSSISHKISEVAHKATEVVDPAHSGTTSTHTAPTTVTPIISPPTL